MSCADYTEYINALKDFHFRDAVLCPLQTRFGGPELGLLIFGAIIIAQTIRQGSIMMAYVEALILGGLILSQVAPVGVAIIGVIVLMVLGAVPVILIRNKLST